MEESKNENKGTRKKSVAWNPQSRASSQSKRIGSVFIVYGNFKSCCQNYFEANFLFDQCVGSSSETLATFLSRTQLL